jgi:hypothetical protein
MRFRGFVMKLGDFFFVGGGAHGYVVVHTIENEE